MIKSLPEEIFLSKKSVTLIAMGFYFGFQIIFIIDMLAIKFFFISALNLSQ